MFNRFITFSLLVSFGFMSLITPAMASNSIYISPTSGVSSGWAAWAANSANFYHMPNNAGYGTAINLPKDNYSVIGQFNWARDTTNPNEAAFNWQMIDGERWITMGREELGVGAISSDQISSRLASFPKTAAYVFAQYNPDSAALIIEIQKIEKTPAGKLVVYRADYTPWHGEYQKWKRDYLTPSELASPSQLGNNPFENFKGSTITDPVFHNISHEGVGVAVGLAMRYSDAHVGWIAYDQTRFTQNTQKSGGLFKKTVTTTINGYAKPQWFVATPVEIQPDGGMSAICVKKIGTAAGNGNTTACDAPEHLASSGVSINSWSGGNMPVNEDLVYNYVNKKSSFTVLAFTILTFALTYGLASAYIGAVGASGTALGGVSALEAGAIGAGLYAGTAVLQGAGLTSAQAGYFGSTGDGVLTPNISAMDQHQQRLIQGTNNRQIYSRVGTGLTGVKSLYSGNCGESYTVSQCKAAGLDPGTMRRPDDYIESNSVLTMRKNEGDCKALGFTGRALQRCAAPQVGAWTVTTGQ